MSRQIQNLRMAAFAAALAASAVPAWSQDKTADQITRELSPALTAMKAHGQSPNMSLEIVAPGQPPVPAYTPPPQAQPQSPQPEPHSEIAVNFDFGSANLKPKSISQLQQVAVALGTPSLANYKFAIIGYTDARGSDAQNLRLSVLRAAAVYDVLTTRFGVWPARLYLQGMGKNNLRGGPDAAENRRVEIVNLL